jgi:hypothetical protein
MVTHQKINEKKHVLSSNLFKNKDFFKILKTDDDSSYLTKFLEQLFQNHISLHQKVHKALFCDVTKVENFD